MKKLDEKILDALKLITRSPYQVLQVTVKSVQTNRTCTVEFPGGIEIENVRLSAVTGSGCIVITPTVGSTVLVGRIMNEQEFYVAQASQADKIEIDGLVVFNQGALNSFMADLNALKDDLNNIKTDINGLKTDFASWVVVPSDGGAALKAITADWYGDPLPPSTIDELKDPNIQN